MHLSRPFVPGLAALLCIAALTVTSCDSAAPPTLSVAGFGSLPSQSGHPVGGGTVSFAMLSADAPRYIFPITPAAYTTAYGTAPELHGAKAYDGAQVMIAALKSCGDCTGLALANAIRTVHYTGLLGTFSYNSTGVGIFATSIGIITDGKIKPVS